MSQVAMMDGAVPNGRAPLAAVLALPNQLRRLTRAGVEALEMRRRLLLARHGAGRLTQEEFLAYGLDRPGTSVAETLRHVGRRRALAWHAESVAQGWQAPLRDRGLCRQLAAGAGLPVPELLAVHAAGPRAFAPAASRSPIALNALLAEPSNYPLLAEPLHNGGPRLALLALEGTTLHLQHGGRLPLAQGMALLARGEGWLIQRRPRAHVALRAAFGAHALPVVHALVVREPTGPKLFSTTMTLELPPEEGEELVVALDAEGTMRRAVRGAGADWRGVRRHQGSGSLLPGRKLPFWEATEALVVRAAEVFSPYPTQCWEVAITDTGPVLLRFAGGEALPLHQLAHGRGLLTPTLVEHLQRQGCRLEGTPAALLHRLAHPFAGALGRRDGSASMLASA
jgi:hypothetical protein